MQASAELGGGLIWNELLDFILSAFPCRYRASQQCASLDCELHGTAAPVRWVLQNLYEPATLEGLQGGGQCGSIHGEHGGYRCHGRGFGAIKGHEERELPIGEPEQAQGFIEPPGQ